MPYRIDTAGDVFDLFENARANNPYGADIWLGHWNPIGMFVQDFVCWRAAREVETEDKRVVETSSV